MNMPLPPVLLLQQHCASMLPALRRVLAACALVLVVVLLLLGLAAADHAEQESERDRARVAAQKTGTLLAAARKAETERAARAKRLAAVSAALAGKPPGEADRETLAARLSGHPHIENPILSLQDTIPATHEYLPRIQIWRLRVEAGLLHEEALLALHAMTLDQPALIVPVGCQLHRIDEAAPVTLQARCDFDWIAIAPEHTR
jgi:hypothetical protein